MSKSTYKRWMTENYLPEADDDDKVVGTREKEDGEKVKVTVKQAMDYSGDDKDMLALKDKAKKSRGDDKGGEEKPDTKKGMAISKTGGFGGEPEDKPFGGDTGKDADFEAELEAVKDELKKLSSSARTGTENEGKIESRELKLYIDNNSNLYNRRFIPIMKNLTKKMKKGKFDKRLAVKGFMSLADDGAKQYVKDHGGDRNTFSKADKIEVAKEFAEEFEDAYKNKEYDFMESVNEANIIQKIDKLAKANKYGTVDGTRMNGKTAKEIMAIFMHPKMNSYRRQMMGMKSHELADLTVSLVKPLKIKVESVNEKISKEEWAQYPAYARKLKPYMQKLLKVPLKVRVIKQAGPNPWIEIRVAKFGKDIIPNDFRVKAAKAIGASNVRDWDNVNYGNIRVNSISLKHDIWVKLLGNKVKV